jgi:hypothetical protein
VPGGVLTGGYPALRRDRHASAAAVFAFVTVAPFPGMLAHTSGDVPTSPDIGPPVKPLYPPVDQRFVLDAAFVESNLRSLGPLVAGLVTQGALDARGYLR